jgi:tetratricopeptide (TPR) repeat protein
MKLNSNSLLIVALAVGLVLCAIPGAHSQTDLDLPYASQAAQVKQRVGVTDITITYHRPLVNGRKIWGGLVPMGQVWRAGANENTTIEFSTPVSVEGKAMPAGTYGLHMIPNADNWTIIFSKMAVAWGSYTYNQSEDALRVDVKPHPTEMEEALEYEFEDLKSDSVTVTMKWEKLAVPFRVSLSEAETVIPSIRNQLRGRAQYSWGPLNEAANYCLTKKTNLEDGLKWVDQSIQIEERFENLSTKADLLQAMNRTDEAKKIRDHAMEVGTPIQLYSYARQLQGQKRSDEAMAIFQSLVKRVPQTVFGHLSQARIKSAAGDFDGALAEAQAAQTVAISDAQKQNIKILIGRLQAKQDINK